MAQFTVVQNQIQRDHNFLSYSRFVKFPSGNNAFSCNTLSELCALDSGSLVGNNDLIYLNLAFPDNFNSEEEITHGWKEDAPNWLLKLDVVYIDGTVIEFPDINTIAAAHQVGFYQGKPFQRVAVDMGLLKSQLTKSCFALRVTCQRTQGDTDPIVCFYGIYKFIGQSVSIPDAFDCRDTVLIEGVYYGYDCDGLYYGSIDEQTDFESPISIRLEGNIKVQEYPMEVLETDSGKTISVTTTQKGIVRLYPFSEEQSKVLAKILSADIVLINGEEWQAKNGLTNTNDSSNDWHSEIQIEREFCKRNSLGCN
jgi:hypothetical protein